MEAEDARTSADAQIRDFLILLKHTLEYMLNETDHYGNEEIRRELQAIRDAVVNLVLDRDLVETSRDWTAFGWRWKFEGILTATNRENMLADVEKACRIMADIEYELCKKHIERLTENQLKEMHHWAISQLKKINADLSLYADRSYTRLQKYADKIGVHDTYESLRSRLVPRYTDPTVIPSWLDPNKKPIVTWGSSALDYATPGIGRFNAESGIGQERCLPKDMMDFNYRNLSQGIVSDDEPPLVFSAKKSPDPSKQRRMPLTKTIVDKNFPHLDEPTPWTEYMARFSRPMSLKEEEDLAKFPLNPTPDYHSYGRPIRLRNHLGRLSEYQDKYIWPSPDRIMRLPWLTQ